MTSPPSALSPEELLAHTRWIRALARHLVGDPTLADDLVQETWAAALNRPPGRERPLRPWLAHVLRNFARMAARGGRRRTERETVVARPDVDERTPSALLEKMETERRLAQLLLGLPDPHRAVLLLRYYEGLTAAQIAQRQGVPAGTVRWRIKEGLDKLRAQLDEGERQDGRPWRVVVGGVAGWPAKKATNAGTSSLTPKVAVGVTAVTVIAAIALFTWRAYGPSTKAFDRPPAAAAAPSWRLSDETPTVEATGVEGRVTTRDGRPLAAFVTLARVPSPGLRGQVAPPKLAAMTRADADGRYHFLAVAEGQYVLVASAEGLAPASADVAVGPTPVIRQDLQLQAAIAHVAGTVRDAGGGPIAGALVRAEPRTGGIAAALTDQDGKYLIGTQLGSHRVIAGADGYAPEELVQQVATRETVDFRLLPAAHISGRTVDRSTGQPLAGALVRLVSEDGHVRPREVSSDAEGNFAFQDLGPGVYALSAQRRALVGIAARPLALSTAGRVSGLIVPMDRGASVAGRVLDPVGGPVADAEVLMEVAAGAETGVAAGPVAARTDPGGRFRVAGVSPGRYRLAARAASHGPTEVRQIVLLSDTENVDLQLRPGARVTGMVVDHTGRAIAGAEVVARVQESVSLFSRWRGSVATRTSADGSFVFDGLSAGQLLLMVSHPDHGAIEEKPVSLAPGARASIRVALGPTTFVTGRVRWHDGAPAADVRVWWAGSGRAHGETAVATDIEGRFRLGPLQKRQGMIRAAHPHEPSFHWYAGGDFGVDARRWLNLTTRAPADLELTIMREDQSLSGVVVAPDGSAVEGAVVFAVRHRGSGPRPPPDGASRQSAFSDEAGRFSLTRLNGGEYAVWARHPAFADAVVYRVGAGSDDVRIAFAAPVFLSGTAMDTSGAPLKGFVAGAVPAWRPGTVAQSFGGREGTWRTFHTTDGAFELGPLNPGEYHLVVRTPVGGAGLVSGLVASAGARLDDLRVTVGTGATLRARVVDAVTGEPLPDVGVALSGELGALHARTDATGAFALEHLPPGRPVSLMVRRDATYSVETLAVDVPPGHASFEIAPIALRRTGIER